jgi:high-affinity K+ transport system ATPase subunit B
MRKEIRLWSLPIVGRAVGMAFLKLDPRKEIRNPVMFMVWVGSVFISVVFIAGLVRGVFDGFNLQIAIWLWFTVLFANFSESMAEIQGKARADALRAMRTKTQARHLLSNGSEEVVASALLKVDDRVVCETGDVIPGDGEVVEGIASVDESAITGESAPVIRESGGDRSAVTGGTRVISDRIVVRITAEQGKTFVDRPPDPALRLLDHLPRGGGHTVVLLRLQREAVRHERLHHNGGPFRLAGVSHPDDDRRTSLRHRHQQREQAHKKERARPERTGC